MKTSPHSAWLLAVAAIALAAVPIVLAVGLGIWAPAAMIHEMFGERGPRD